MEDLESGDGFDDLESASGDMEEDSKANVRHPLEWVERLRNGDVIFADRFDIESISEFVNNYQSNVSICYTSQGSKKLFRGESLNTINSDTERNRRYVICPPGTSRNDCRRYIGSTYQYPEYAVGFLDNGCFSLSRWALPCHDFS